MPQGTYQFLLPSFLLLGRFNAILVARTETERTQKPDTADRTNKVRKKSDTKPMCTHTHKLTCTQSKTVV